MREEAREEARIAWLSVLVFVVVGKGGVQDAPVGFRDRGLTVTGSGTDEVVERVVGCRGGVLGGTGENSASVFRGATIGNESLPDLGTGGWGTDGGAGLFGV